MMGTGTEEAHRRLERVAVVQTCEDRRGAQRENSFIALDGDGGSLGSPAIYPFFAYDTEPEHPHNLYLHLQTAHSGELGEAVKDALLERALRRAEEIKQEAGQEKTRTYACFFEHQQEQIAYFLTRGFFHDEGMYILARDGSTPWPAVEVPEDVTIET